MQRFDTSKTILVVHECPRIGADAVRRLTEADHRVVGPVSTAAMALALAAGTSFDIALIGARLAGRRSGAELATALNDTWGVRSLKLPDDPAAWTDRYALEDI